MNTEIDQASPKLINAPNEKIQKMSYNSYIIGGTDCPDIESSGVGGKGGTHADRIDIICGLASAYPDGTPNSETSIRPNFANDAARIYITQKGHVDHYMGITETEPHNDTKDRSAIGMVADSIRFHSREGVKIVTGRGRFVGRNNNINSKGGEIHGVSPIEIIPGNFSHDEEFLSFNMLNANQIGKVRRKKVQSLIRGDDLVSMLKEQVDILKQMVERIDTNTSNIKQLANSYSNHIHDATPGFGGPSTPSSHATIGGTFTKIQNMISKVQHKNVTSQLNTLENNYLAKQGSQRISSPYVKVV